MAGFVDSLRNMWRIEELRKRIIYTLSLLAVYRIGTYVTLPGVDPTQLIASQNTPNNIFGLIDLFVGGAFAKAGIFALGIMPYITVSIIVQLMGAVVPYFQKLQREGEDGRRKINQLTRQGTVLITAFQAYGYAIQLLGTASQAITVNHLMFYISTIIVLTAGTIFVMWLGERITEAGIGNGISLIITIGIVARLPHSLYNEATAGVNGNLFIFIIEILVWLLIIAAVVWVSQGVRRIPVQYAKRVVGRKVMGGSTQYLPIKINAAGVMPIIFAQSILFIPTTIALFFPDSPFWQSVGAIFGDYTGFWHALFFFILIVFFTYFYTAIAVNPKSMADDMKRNGGFIPGIRPGKQTSEFVDNILTRVTLPGAIFLGFVAILPTIATAVGIDQGWAQFFGGTSLLIMVQVTLDTLQQIESHLLMRRYDGFMKSGRMRGRM
ncbi:MAG TPA: preprotein translocase subunit SecY [Rhodothermales bacterium]|nr:preprotein translocase subunit SecY [Rhodothermales bacterium]HRR09680.1 preprotein translocase subunit SecY [Rhodothermales bacterium]